MPLSNYSVLKGRPVRVRLGSGRSPHYQIHLVAGDEDFRIAVNVQSGDGSEVEYLVRSRFDHPVLTELAALAPGLHPAPPRPGGIALDYIRGNLMTPQEMVPLPVSVPGPDNDLNERIDQYLQRALADETAFVYGFGEPWGPEGAADSYFGFRPGCGLHDIHMNQGNPPPPQGRQNWFEDNGPWQDGGLIVEFPGQAQWVAVFLKFQNQAWHTDEVTGRPIEGPPETRRDGQLRIVAALVNDTRSPERETVTLLNTTDLAVDLAGWALLDRNDNRMVLSGAIEAGAARRFDVTAPMQLANRGGTITLLDPAGLKVDGVAYTREQARSEGRTIVF